MKIWKFYKKPSDMNDSSFKSLSDKYPLYAITNNKKMMEKFLELRDRDKFIMRVDSIDSDDYAIFANMNRSTVMGQYRLSTVKKNKTIKIDLIMTSLEYNEVCEAGITLLDSMIDWSRTVTPKILKEKYLQTLNNMGYTEVYNMYNDRDLDSGSYSTPYISFDELNIFLHLYEEVLK